MIKCSFMRSLLGMAIACTLATGKAAAGVGLLLVNGQQSMSVTPNGLKSTYTATVNPMGVTIACPQAQNFSVQLQLSHMNGVQAVSFSGSGLTWFNGWINTDNTSWGSPGTAVQGCGSFACPVGADTITALNIGGIITALVKVQTLTLKASSMVRNGTTYQATVSGPSVMITSPQDANFKVAASLMMYSGQLAVGFDSGGADAVHGWLCIDNASWGSPSISGGSVSYTVGADTLTNANFGAILEVLIQQPQ